MKTLIYKQFIYFGILTALLVNLTSARTFTNKEGREIEASVIEVGNDSVQLQIDGKKEVYTIPFSTLSQADVEYLKAYQKPKPNEELSTTKKESKSKRRLSTAALKELYDLSDNFDAKWPSLISSSIDIDVKIVSQNAEEKKFVYHSPNYEFICDVRLSQNVLNKFSVMFEATREFCRLLPISTMKAHVPGEKKRNTILLFEEYHDYIANGGLPDSAGVYIPNKNIVIVPLESVGVKKVGSGYMFDYDKSNRTLIHEIVHQLTDPEYYAPGARGWFSEGLAEYCANTPYRSGKFMVRTNVSSIKAFATGYGKDGKRGRNIKEEFTAPDLEKYMLMSYDSFRANANFNYAFGMLLTYYFFHMEEDRSNVNNFMKALKDGKSGQDALDQLLNGRSYSELEENISKKWRSKGVKIHFP